MARETILRYVAVMLDGPAICVTFFFDRDRLRYLAEVAAQFPSYARDARIFVVTNVGDRASHQTIKAALGDLDAEIVVPTWLGHPYLLTWVHREVFRRVFEEDDTRRHFLYLEDDLKLTEENVAYWLEGREKLRPYGLYPSFLRYELSSDGRRMSSDVVNARPISVRILPHVRITDAAWFVNLPQPYQGMYLMDRELFSEFSSDSAQSPDFGRWPIREKAAQGLTFFNVPEGFSSRNAVGYHLHHGIDRRALVHHLPNNYARNPKRGLGSIEVDRLLTSRPQPVRAARGKVLGSLRAWKRRLTS